VQRCTLPTPSFRPVRLDLGGLVRILEGLVELLEGGVCARSVGVEDVIGRLGIYRLGELLTVPWSGHLRTYEATTRLTQRLGNLWLQRACCPPLSVRLPFLRFSFSVVDVELVLAGAAVVRVWSRVESGGIVCFVRAGGNASIETETLQTDGSFGFCGVRLCGSSRCTQWSVHHRTPLTSNMKLMSHRLPNIPRGDRFSVANNGRQSQSNG